MSNTPFGFLQHARDFQLSADKVMSGKDQESIDGLNMVAYYLLGHAIELALKAYLFHKGVSVEHLRIKYGHDLSKLLECSVRLGIDAHVAWDKNDKNAVLLLNQNYKKHVLRYSEYEFEYICPEYFFMREVVLRITRGVVSFPNRQTPHK